MQIHRQISTLILIERESDVGRLEPVLIVPTQSQRSEDFLESILISRGVSIRQRRDGSAVDELLHQRGLRVGESGEIRWPGIQPQHSKPVQARIQTENSRMLDSRPTRALPSEGYGVEAHVPRRIHAEIDLRVDVVDAIWNPCQGFVGLEDEAATVDASWTVRGRTSSRRDRPRRRRRRAGHDSDVLCEMSDFDGER